MIVFILSHTLFLVDDNPAKSRSYCCCSLVCSFNGIKIRTIKILDKNSRSTVK